MASNKKPSAWRLRRDCDLLLKQGIRIWGTPFGSRGYDLSFAAGCVASAMGVVFGDAIDPNGNSNMLCIGAVNEVVAGRFNARDKYPCSVQVRQALNRCARAVHAWHAANA